jgi:putative tricarboxylic transport membrane protein
MIDQAMQGFLSVFSFATLPLLLLGIFIGIIIGILPGIGGVAGIVLALPFVYKLPPGDALAFLLAMHSVCATGGGVTSVLFNVPGEAFSAATLLDGYPMAQKGQAGRAIGALVCASGFGGIFGGLVLIGCYFIVRPIVMSVGLAEYFFLIIFGLSLIVTLGTGSVVKGVISGLLGVFLSFFGVAIMTGEPRFWFGSFYLIKGFGIVPVSLGLFAIPTVIEMYTTHESVSKVDKADVKGEQVWEGVKDVFRHFRVFIQSSIIGTIIGIIPGVGAQVATFLAYGVAKQTSKHPEDFGQGCVEGVIAPEAADNAKEGGALLPTLALGIPGSVSMSILMGAFILVGLQPGPLFLQEHADIAFKLAGTIIYANVIAAVIIALFAGRLASLTFVRSTIVAPVVLTLTIVGAFCASGEFLDIVGAFVFGLLGYALNAYGYSRASLMLGYILGDMAEKYFGLCMRTLGPLFFLRPVPLIFILLIILVMFGKPIKAIFTKRRIKC